MTFVWTTGSVLTSVALVSVATAVCLLGWRRSGYSLRTGLLELLRWSIILLVAATLNQPEWLVRFSPDQRPALVILRDISDSMQTADVAADSSAADASSATTRADWAQKLTDAELWKPVSDALDLVVESFSSALTPPTDGTDLHAALLKTVAHHPTLRAVVVLSDGDWNAGEPPVKAASQYRVKGIPIHCVAVGSETQVPDIDLVRVDAPTFGVVGKPLRIPYVVDSMLPRDHEVQVTLTPSRGAEVTETLTLPPMSRTEETLLWTPESQGEYELKISIPVDSQEQIADNNTRVVPISVREEAIKVLLVESLPRWEYRYLRNALERDPGVDVSCLLFHPGLPKVGGGRGYISSFPNSMESLSQFDVLFLGDVGVGGGELTTEQCHLIKGLIEQQASGLIFMPGMLGRQLSFLDTDLESLYPVTLDPHQTHGWGSRTPSQMELTYAGRRSLLTRLVDSEDENARLWESLPGFHWHAAVQRAKINTQVLATHRTDRLPLLVTMTYGTGKVLFMGTDAAWRWREGVEDKYHYRFWGQVARWMAYQRSMAAGQNMRLFFTPDRPQRGDSITFYANVSASDGAPLQNGVVTLHITTPTGKLESVRLLPSGDEWGLFANTYTPQEQGRFLLRLSSQENPSSLEATLNVQGTVRERRGRPARLDVLREIADVSGGELVGPADLGRVVEAIRELPKPAPDVRRLRLWCHPVWVGLLIFLLASFWVGRKMVGTV